MTKRIYLDNAATTRVSDEVVKEMLPYFGEIYGNANSLHGAGRDASKGVEIARNNIVKLIGASASELYFTSGGTEANNWALRGVVEACSHRGKHIIVSAIEHHSIIDTAAELARQGIEVDYLGVDASGRVDFEKLKSLVRDDTILVSIMTVNNEVGTIQDIAKIGEFLKDKKCYFHTDAVQALSAVKIDVNAMHIDLLSCSSHKIHGPKGVGALYIRDGVSCKRFMIGGEQEKSRRGGTTNVPACVGFGKAAEILYNSFDEHVKKVNEVSSYFISKVESKIGNVVLNSPRKNRAPAIVNFSFGCVEGESILFLLDFDNICVSTGSACASGSLQKSHVLKAMGQTPALINGAVRFSFDENISLSDVDFVVKKLDAVVKRLREMSPLS